MPNSLFERIDRLKAVEREFHVVKDALGLLRAAVAEGRVALPGGTSLRDLDAVRRQIKATFLIRLWAEFESAVGSYYGSLQSTPNLQTRAVDLIDTVAAFRSGRAVNDNRL